MCLRSEVSSGEDQSGALLSMWIHLWSCEHLANFWLGFSDDGRRVCFLVCDGSGNHA